jgi:hypothetical protein
VAQAEFRLNAFAVDLERRENERLVRLALEAAAEMALQAQWEATRKVIQTEQDALNADVTRQKAAFSSKHVVLGSALITCGAGLNIKHVMSDFESCRLTVKNLPLNAKRCLHSKESILKDST